MHKPESVLENETHQIQILRYCQKTRPCVNKKNCRFVDFAIPAEQRVKIKKKRKDRKEKYLDFAKELEKKQKNSGI